MSEETKTFKFNDDVVSVIAKTLQLAILTGTDIVDNLRTLRLSVDGDQVTVSRGFLESFEKNVQKMLEEAQAQETVDSPEE